MATGSEPQHLPDEQRGYTKWNITSKQIIAAVIVVVALMFILQNTSSGHFSFLWFDFQAPLWIWMLVVFAAGVATGLLVARRRARRKAAQA